MNDTTQQGSALFAANAQSVNNDFSGHAPLARRLAALLYAQEGKPIDCEAVRQCHTLIKQNTGVFSAFRGYMTLCMATLLSLSPNSQDMLNETLKVYALLRDEKFFPSDLLVVAAYQIASRSNAFEYAKVVTHIRAFYDCMKEQRFFHFGRDDYVFAAMLGLTGLDAVSEASRIEELYVRLKGEFLDKDSVRTLVQVLVLGTQDDNTVYRVLSLKDALRAQKVKLDKGYTLPLLGILALLPIDIDTIVRDIDETQAALRAEKGFGVLSVPKQELLLYVASLTAGKYIHNIRNRTLTATLSTDITNIILVQQAAMIAAISASIAAAS